MKQTIMHTVFFRLPAALCLALLAGSLTACGAAPGAAAGAGGVGPEAASQAALDWQGQYERCTWPAATPTPRRRTGWKTGRRTTGRP